MASWLENASADIPVLTQAQIDGQVTNRPWHPVG